MSSFLRRKKYYFLTIFFMVIGFLIGNGVERQINAMPSKSYEELSVFSDALHLIQTNYVDEVDIKELVAGAIRGMLKTLDPHSSYMTPDLFKEMQIETSGSFGGLGIEIGMRDNILTVISPIEDTPAFKAGIQAGDKIIKIAGESTKNMTLEDAVKMMRGKKGTPITITIMRESFTIPQDFTIVRDIIMLKSIRSAALDAGIGYIRISSFQEKTGEDLMSSLKKLQDEGNLKKGLILDLRNNPGGLLNQAVSVSDSFISSGLIVYTDGRLKTQRTQFSAHDKDTFLDFPMIVLVNSGSASASEIVAGALQDHKRALILGERTFGKGSVQTIMRLADESALRLTTAKYYTPNGRSIQAKGIEPDIAVKRIFKPVEPEKGKEQPEDHVVREKDLDGHFENEDGGEEAPAKEEKKENIDEEEPVEPDSIKENSVTKDYEYDKDDNQLVRAIDILKSLEIFQNLQVKK